MGNQRRFSSSDFFVQLTFFEIGLGLYRHATEPIFQKLRKTKQYFRLPLQRRFVTYKLHICRFGRPDGNVAPTVAPDNLALGYFRDLDTHLDKRLLPRLRHIPRSFAWRMAMTATLLVIYFTYSLRQYF